ncbi:hypothetical protein [Streptomyces poonensis]|uniref:Uncharacterized protein n=1 Tax=Streptomyces poonensis TaxID=68255 RepID=A0A918PT44_9ACTN|nr:hypothetical protein [Streptomyces poonensis]GGZ20329.1 hypothetical protein GCM10010365_45790 [Streptomyces poonensis]
MTSDKDEATPPARLRYDAPVDKDTFDHARTEIHAGMSRPGLSAGTGEEATGPAVVDKLVDRLRRRTDGAAHARDDGHRTTAPPWRGGRRSA